jgi:hypothetical protein
MFGEGEQYHRDFTALEEDADGWINAMTFSGDPYRDADNVVRGVQIGNVSEAMGHPAGIGHEFCHDDLDDLRRLAGLPDNLESGCGGLLPYKDADLLPEASFKAFAADDSMSSTKFRSTVNEPQRFSPFDEPPSPPTDEYWNYEVTTILVKTTNPNEGYKIGNQLLAFLQNEVVSSIHKVRKPSETNFRKFSIKADVFIKNIMCTLKIRLNQDKERGANWYCVEFQRRSGDCVSFNKAYQEACTYLRTHMGATAGGPNNFAPEPPQLHDDTMDVVVTQDEIRPLLDMAAMKQMPGLQAESATALASLAQDRTRATLLCNVNAFEQIRNLLLSNQNAVAYPTAQLLSSLAQLAEATLYFVEQGILQAILDKVRSQATSALVQKHLMQTLSIAISRCVPLLSDENVGELLGGLSAAAKAGSFQDGLDREGENAFHRSLQDATSALQHKPWP